MSNQALIGILQRGFVFTTRKIQARYYFMDSYL